MGKEVKCSICGKHVDEDYFNEHVSFYHKKEEKVYYTYIHPHYTPIQKEAIESIKELYNHFPQRWFIQQEILGISLNTFKSLVKKNFLEMKEINLIIYYKMIEE